jgi:DNA-binding response OmpR family regulator
MSKDPVHAFRILVAGTDSYRREQLVHLLAREGSPVWQADAEAAWPVAQEHLPHLVIAYQAPPEMDGVSFTSRIRQHPLLGSSYVFLVSEHEEEETEALAFITGADEYLVEPLRPRPLLSRIDALRRKTVH